VLPGRSARPTRRRNSSDELLVGLVWLGMIGWQLGHGTTPWFLIVMVPVVGVFRYLTYLHYQRIG
jgi:F0F1-type ATP synthase assembly protein I